MAKFRQPTGTQDILPADIPLRRYVEATTRHLFELYGYQEIRTPIFEYTPLFVRSIGNATDIVEKEMYTFHSSREDSAGQTKLSKGLSNQGNSFENTLTLRPELTAPVVRAYLEHHFAKSGKFQKFYYIGPIFRHERPQKGRFRQFDQIGLEVLGSHDYLIDVEVIKLSLILFHTLGIKNEQLAINSIGCPKCRASYQSVLKDSLAQHISDLCENCQHRFQRNVLRILDCKNEKCYDIVNHLISIDKFLCQDCKLHFKQLTDVLDELNISYKIDHHLVRGLDYYTKTIFEIRHNSLGARNDLGGGGRYDNLVEDLGGPPTGAMGVAIGIERIILALKSDAKHKIDALPAPGLKVFIVTVDPAVRKHAFKLLNQLREKNIPADMNYETRSLKSQMRLADRLNVSYVIIIGLDEIQKGTVKLKNMKSGVEQEIKKEAIYEML